MSSPTYEAVALLQDGSNFDIGATEQRLAGRFPAMTVSRRGRGITIAGSGWEAHLYLAEEPFVAEESREMAEYYAKCPRAAEIGKCKRRVEVWSEDPDPGMRHINDFILILEVLGEFKGVILLDPRSGDLL